MIYTLVKQLIATGKTDGLIEKLDVFLLADRITEIEYQEFRALLNAA